MSSSSETSNARGGQAGSLAEVPPPGSPPAVQAATAQSISLCGRMFVILYFLDSETTRVTAAPGCRPEAMRAEFQRTLSGGSSWLGMKLLWPEQGGAHPTHVQGASSCALGFSPVLFQGTCQGWGIHREKPQPTVRGGGTIH